MDSNRIAAAGLAVTGAHQTLMAHMFTTIDEYIHHVVTADRSSARSELERFGLCKVADLLDLPRQRDKTD